MTGACPGIRLRAAHWHHAVLAHHHAPAPHAHQVEVVCIDGGAGGGAPYSDAPHWNWTVQTYPMMPAIAVPYGAVPEPSMTALLIVGLVAMWVLRIKHRRKGAQ